MNPFLVASIALMPAVAVPLWTCVRGSIPLRLAGVQFGSTLACIVIAVMSFAFDEPSLLDLSLTLAFLSLPGMLLFAIFTERWL